MGTAGLRAVGKAASERLTGLGPGPFRAALAAAVTGSATAVLTYRLLRSDNLLGDDE
jgi:hypothetical protein